MFFSSLNRVINVPITDDNIAKRVNSLPRSEDNSGMVNIGLKRKLNMKNYHKHGLINPNRVYKACEYLVKNHPAYKEIRLKSYDEWAEKCPSLFSHTDKSDEEEVEDSSDNEAPEKTAEKSQMDKEKGKDEADGKDITEENKDDKKSAASGMVNRVSNLFAAMKKSVKKPKDSKYSAETPESEMKVCFTYYTRK